MENSNFQELNRALGKTIQKPERFNLLLVRRVEKPCRNVMQLLDQLCFTLEKGKNIVILGENNTSKNTTSVFCKWF